MLLLLVLLLQIERGLYHGNSIEAFRQLLQLIMLQVGLLAMGFLTLHEQERAQVYCMSRTSQLTRTTRDSTTVYPKHVVLT